MSSFTLRPIAAAAVIAAGVLPAVTASAQSQRAANPLPDSYYAKSSAMSQGHWAKVSVNREGIHQITYDELRQLGFSDPTRVKVCGYGGASLTHDTFRTSDPDDIAATQYMHTADGRVLFYGVPDVTARIDGYYKNGSTVTPLFNTGVYRNYYATYGCYLLTDAENIAAPAQATAFGATEEGAVTDSHLSLQYYEPEVDVPKHRSGDTFADFRTAIMHGGSIPNNSAPYPVPFDIRDYDRTAAAPAQMYLAIAMGWDNFGSTKTLEVGGMEGFTVAPASYEINGRTVSLPLSINPYSYYTGYTNGSGFYSVTPDAATESTADGSYSALVSFFKNMAAEDACYQAFDRGSLIYPRLNRIGDFAGGLVMDFTSAPATTAIRLTGADASTCVWDVTDTYRITPCEVRQGTDAGTALFTPARSYDITDASAGCARIVAFNPAQQQLPVTLVGPVANQNLHSLAEADMLIITTDALYDAACQLAQIHKEHDGSIVAVATQQQIFNEFSSGTPDLMAYRRLVKMLHDRNPERLRAVLLYGTSLSDNRQIVMHTNMEKLLIYEVLPVSKSLNTAVVEPEIHFGTDNYVGMIDGNYNPELMHRSYIHVPVSRLPVTDAGVAAKVNEKIRNYLNADNSAYYPRVLLTADDGDESAHFEDSRALCEAMKKENAGLSFINDQVSLYPRPNSSAPGANKKLLSSMNSGIGFFGYSGHGNSDALTGEGLLNNNDVQKMKNKVLPVAMISSCNTNCYDLEGTGSITQQMILNPNGGMIAAIGSARSVYQNYNQTINLAVGRAYASAKGGTTLGSWFADAVNHILDPDNMASSDQLRFNTLCYGIIGDPLVPIAAPGYSATVSTINDIAVTDGSIAEVKPLTKVHITGQIEGDENASTFNGVLKLRLMDGADSIKTIINSKGEKEITFTDEHLELASAAAKVVNGKWEADIFVPHSTYAKLTNKAQAEDSETDTRMTNRLILTASGTVAENVRTQAMGYTDRIRVLDQTDAEFSGAGPVIEQFYINTPSFVEGALTERDVTAFATVRLGEAGLSTSDIMGSAGRLELDGGSRVFSGAASAFVINPDGTASLTYPIGDLAPGRHTLTLNVRDNAGQMASASLSFVATAEDARPTLVLDREIARDELVMDLTGEVFEATEADGNRDVHLYVYNDKGDIVLRKQNISFPYTWDLKDNDGKDVADGHYQVRVLTRLGSLYTRASGNTTVIKY